MAEVDSSEMDISQVDSSQDPEKKLTKVENVETLEYKCNVSFNYGVTSHFTIVEEDEGISVK